MAAVIKQLTLPIANVPTQLFDNFIAGENQELVKLLQGLASNENTNSSKMTFITGLPGDGKSHLLNATCNMTMACEKLGVYIDLNNQDTLHPMMLDGLECSHLICIDNVDAVLLDREWEVALFDLINRVLELQQSHIVMTAQKMPKLMSFCLPDLASRLVWGQCFHISPLNELQRLSLLTLLAEQSGLSLDEGVAKYLLHRVPRDLHSLSRIMQRLDEYSLQAQRRLTIPLVKEALQEIFP